jgi:nicotinate-nucleotide pyrophosphorylase (carboxylating)
MRDFLSDAQTLNIIRAALQEDIGSGDHTSLATIPADAVGTMKCLMKETGVIAGIHFAEKVFLELDPNAKFEALTQEGQLLPQGTIVFRVRGKVQALLSAERLALNAMQRMSGIATLTRQAVQAIEGTQCTLLDTRKTTPLVRHLEKWAVTIGGGSNHRFGLYDMILIKDNHIDFAGGIIPAIQAVQEYIHKKGLEIEIEIEARNIEDVLEILAFGKVQRILLDNMNPDMMRECVNLIGDRFQTEASGNITLANIREKAETGVNFISLGALTHSFKSLDISLKYESLTAEEQS